MEKSFVSDFDDLVNSSSLLNVSAIYFWIFRRRGLLSDIDMIELCRTVQRRENLPFICKLFLKICNVGGDFERYVRTSCKYVSITEELRGNLSVSSDSIKSELLKRGFEFITGGICCKSSAESVDNGFRDGDEGSLYTYLIFPISNSSNYHNGPYYKVYVPWDIISYVDLSFSSKPDQVLLSVINSKRLKILWRRRFFQI